MSDWEKDLIFVFLCLLCEAVPCWKASSRVFSCYLNPKTCYSEKKHPFFIVFHFELHAFLVFLLLEKEPCVIVTMANRAPSSTSVPAPVDGTQSPLQPLQEVASTVEYLHPSVLHKTTDVRYLPARLYGVPVGSVTNQILKTTLTVAAIQAARPAKFRKLPLTCPHCGGPIGDNDTIVPAVLFDRVVNGQRYHVVKGAFCVNAGSGCVLGWVTENYSLEDSDTIRQATFRVLRRYYSNITTMYTCPPSLLSMYHGGSYAPAAFYGWAKAFSKSPLLVTSDFPDASSEQGAAEKPAILDNIRLRIEEPPFVEADAAMQVRRVRNSFHSNPLTGDETLEDLLGRSVSSLNAGLDEDGNEIQLTSTECQNLRGMGDKRRPTHRAYPLARPKETGEQPLYINVLGELAKGNLDAAMAKMPPSFPPTKKFSGSILNAMEGEEEEENDTDMSTELEQKTAAPKAASKVTKTTIKKAPQPSPKKQQRQRTAKTAAETEGEALFGEKVPLDVMMTLPGKGKDSEVPDEADESLQLLLRETMAEPATKKPVTPSSKKKPRKSKTGTKSKPNPKAKATPKSHQAKKPVSKKGKSPRNAQHPQKKSVDKKVEDMKEKQ